MSVETSPVGTARPCCLFRSDIKQDNGESFSLSTGTLEEAYNTKFMQKLRNDFRDGVQRDECKSCWDEEAAGRQSKRVSSSIRLKHIVDTIDLNANDSKQIKFLDLKLGNICNIKCRICGSWSSSKWAKEENNTWSKKMLKLGSWPRNNNKFWSNLETMLPNIVYFEFTGGEPFLIKQHFDLLKKAVELGYAKNIEIHYNTNATTWPEEALNIWRHFKTVEIAFSIDNLGKRFEYERHGAKWKTAEQIVKFTNGLRYEMPNIQTQMCLTVNVFNVYYLEEICEWMSKQKFNYDYFNMLHGEPEFRIDQLTPDAKELVLNKLQNGNFTPEHRKQIDFIINFINNGPGSDGKKFIEKVKKTDTYRKQCMLDTHKEIAEAMGYDSN